MKNRESSLFQIGEVAKFVGVTRKMLLNFEAQGLLTPAYQDEESGYRYYSADNITQVRAIRALQSLGLTLREVREYYYDTANIDAQLKRLTDLRATLDRNIQLLQIRAARPGQLPIRWATLPRRVCFARRYVCGDVAEAAVRLRETYIAAAHSGYRLSSGERMFTQRMGQSPTALDLLCCIPMEEGFDGEERMEFPETQVVCVYYRGPYEGIADACGVLARYVKENGIRTEGGFQSVYLEGPANRGTNAADYITQIALPVADRRQGAYGVFES
ncbi:MerR family transcriptional regulator [Oscillibacter sp.]|uniref:MerR family transcriptional regulator n=1 Tax=Oscillibacter sp. TaxID=1945593 RepID=UPI0026309AC4|nr:MerR family transcriptional regulator [Oscillibacter sp.]MDD3346872.1 MerR family transcriptional regulator [Oscillibacter sp.]